MKRYQTLKTRSVNQYQNAVDFGITEAVLSGSGYGGVIIYLEDLQIVIAPAHFWLR